MALTRRRALLLGAAASVAPHHARAQTTELNFWTWRQEDRAQYAELFKAFTDNAPGVTVRFNGYEPQNYATVLSAALAAGSGPDVIHIRAYGGQEQFSKSGYLHALDTASVPELANFPADALAAMTLRSDKKIYAVPFASQTLGVFINTELFAKQGWKPAADWVAFLELCQQIKAAGLIPLANGTATAWMVEVFTSVFTGSHLGEAFEADLLSGRATFEDPRYVTALTKLTELKEHMPRGNVRRWLVRDRQFSPTKSESQDGVCCATSCKRRWSAPRLGVPRRRLRHQFKKHEEGRSSQADPLSRDAAIRHTLFGTPRQHFPDQGRRYR
jgi:raffinose/stachyose/melibiose transport system substrate-binding protein